jgi:hypothetical protein
MKKLKGKGKKVFPEKKKKKKTFLRWKIEGMKAFDGNNNHNLSSGKSEWI